MSHVTFNQQHAAGSTPGAFQSFCGHCFRQAALQAPRPGRHLAINDPKVVDARRALFGSWETNGLAYNVAHDLELPGTRRPSSGLMYPRRMLLQSSVRSGHAVTRLPAESCGIVSVDEGGRRHHVEDGAVTVIHAQNESGTLQPCARSRMAEVARSLLVPERYHCHRRRLAAEMAREIASCEERSLAGTNALSHRYQQPAALATGCF